VLGDLFEFEVGVRDPEHFSACIRMSTHTSSNALFRCKVALQTRSGVVRCLGGWSTVGAVAG
jgi:hypothetical protein